MPDQEIPPARPAARRIDETSADVQTLVKMGAVEPPPEPAPEAKPEPPAHEPTDAA